MITVSNPLKYIVVANTLRKPFDPAVDFPDFPTMYKPFASRSAAVLYVGRARELYHHVELITAATVELAAP